MSTVLTDDGVEIHYRSTGAGPPVLLIHGLGSSGEDWEYQIDPLAGRYQVITVDLRGHGRSGRPPTPYTMARFAADVLAVLDALALERVHVVGISMGGGVAFQLAVDQPQRVASLTIVNSGPSMRLPDPKFRFALWLRRLMARWMSPAQAAPRIAQKLFPDPAMADRRDSFIARMARNDRQAYRKSLEAFVNWGVAERIGTLAMPTLVIAAEQDYTPVALKQQYVAQMPRATLAVVPDAHHALPMEYPERFNPLLLQFLDALGVDAQAAQPAPKPM